MRLREADRLSKGHSLSMPNPVFPFFLSCLSNPPKYLAKISQADVNVVAFTTLQLGFNLIYRKALEVVIHSSFIYSAGRAEDSNTKSCMALKEFTIKDQLSWKYNQGVWELKQGVSS